MKFIVHKDNDQFDSEVCPLPGTTRTLLVFNNGYKATYWILEVSSLEVLMTLINSSYHKLVLSANQADEDQPHGPLFFIQVLTEDTEIEVG